MTYQYLISTFSAMVCLSFLSGCAEKVESQTTYQVVDTGYWPADNILAEPLWLDNSRIIFTSSQSLKPEKRPYRIKIYNTQTGELITTELESVRCVRDGQIVNLKQDESTSEWIYYRGLIENLVVHPMPRPNMHMDRQFDCDWVDNQSSQDVVPYQRQLLGENFIEIAEKSNKTYEYQKRPQEIKQKKQNEDKESSTEGKVIYYSHKGSLGRELPTGRITYSEFLDAYLIGHSYYSPKWPETRSFWILQRDGNLEEVQYPKEMLEGNHKIYPIISGYLVVYGGGKYTQKYPGSNGIYAMYENHIFPIIMGSVHGVSVAKDGCKAAFFHANMIKEYLSPTKPYRTVKYINFC